MHSHISQEYLAKEPPLESPPKRRLGFRFARLVPCTRNAAHVVTGTRIAAPQRLVRIAMNGVEVPRPMRRVARIEHGIVVVFTFDANGNYGVAVFT